MTTKERIIIIAVLWLVFLISGTILIASLYGLVWDPNTYTFSKTGSISLAYNKRNATLAINGRIQSTNPGLLWGNVLIKNLKPGTYKVELFEPGYHAYKKNLRVKPGIVTKAESITLWPLAPSERIISSSTVDRFGLTSEGAIMEVDGRILSEHGEPLRGKTIIETQKDSPYVLTAEGTAVFATNLREPKRAINIDSLLLSLLKSYSKHTSLKVQQVRLLPSQTGHFLVKTDTANFSLDLTNLKARKLDFLGSEALEFEAVAAGNTCRLNVNKTTIMIFSLEHRASSTVNLSQPALAALSNDKGCFVYLEDGTLTKIVDQQAVWSHKSPLPLSLRESPDEKYYLIVNQNHELYAGAEIYDEQGIFSDDAPLLRLPADDLGRVIRADFLPHNQNQIVALTEKGLYIVERDPRDSTNTVLLHPSALDYAIIGRQLYTLTAAHHLLKMDLSDD